MGGERRGKGEREGRKGTEEVPTKNSCRGAQNVKLRHCAHFNQIRFVFKMYDANAAVNTAAGK